MEGVRLLGHDEPLVWEQAAGGLAVTLPDRDPMAHAFGLRIKGSGLVP